LCLINNYKVWISRLTQLMMLQIFILGLQLFRPFYEAIIRSKFTNGECLKISQL
jgi:hypothetical protein